MCDAKHCLMNHYDNDDIQRFIDACCAELQIESGRIDWWWDDDTEMGSTWGCCYGDDEEQTIEINCGAPRDEIWEVIAHEVIHCKQHQCGQLVETTTDNLVPGVYWRAEDGSQTFYTSLAVQAYIEKLDDIQVHEAYLNRPWEKEAYAGQSRLADKALLRMLDD